MSISPRILSLLYHSVVCHITVISIFKIYYSVSVLRLVIFFRLHLQFLTLLVLACIFASPPLVTTMQAMIGYTWPTERQAEKKKKKKRRKEEKKRKIHL